MTCVVPTHDRPDSLRRALRSILSQSPVPPAQIIVVDDLGQPGARDVVDEVRTTDGPRIEYVDVSTDNGPRSAGRSRNRGAELADHPVIAFLDDDDTWCAGFLASCLARLAESTADLVAADLVLRSSGDDAGSRRCVRVHSSASDILAENPGVTGSNVVIRRESFDRVGGFDPSLPVYNDLDLLVRLLDAGVRYESVGQALVIHSTAGPDHLSTRDERRARGVEQYLAKYSDRLTWRQRRTILQDIYLSRHRAGQPFARGVRLVFLILATSSPREVLSSARSRMTGSGRPYS